MSKLNGKEKEKFNVLMVSEANKEVGKYNFALETEDGMALASFTLNTLKYNEETKKYEDNEEYMNNAIQFLSEYGTTLDTIQNLVGQTVELYALETDEGDLKVSLSPIKGFIKFEKPDISTEMYFQDNVTLPIKTMPIVDNKNFEQFTLGFAIGDEGNEKYYKVSTVKKITEVSPGKFSQEKCSLKYDTNKIIEASEKDLTFAPNDAIREKLLQLRDRKCQNVRKAKIDKISEFFGKDIYDIIKDEDTFNIKKIIFEDWEMNGESGKYITVVLDI